MRLEAGMIFPDFLFRTPWKPERSFYQATGEGKTVLIFLRYFGCSTCQLDIWEFAEEYQRFIDKGARLFVVLQSEETLREQLQPDDLPYDIICDPDRELYLRFDIGSNPHPDDRSQRLEERIRQARARGIKHGQYEGNEAQSPATFILDQDHRIIFSLYGVESTDVPSVDELIEML